VRVLIVNDVAIDAGWGAEAHIARLVRGLVAAGDEVDVFAGEVTHDGARKVLDVWDPFARRALRARGERFRPDVVHYHNVLRELSVSVLGVPAGVPGVLTVHEHRLLGVLDNPLRTPRDALKLPLSRLHRRVARRQVDVVIGVSRRLSRELTAAGFRSVEHVPQFADTAPPGLACVPVREARDVVMAGKLTPDKGVRVLAEAFVAVAARHPDARLVVAGEGPEAATLEAIAAQLGSDRVQLLGKIDQTEVQSLFARARVVAAPAVPSIRPEGAGNTPIEAALVGRPVIVSDAPGHREFVDESGGGLVVPAGSVPDLAAALDTLLADDDLAQRLGDAGRRMAEERRSTAAVVPTVRGIYQQAIALRRSRVGAP